MDSGFQSLVGFRILSAGFWIPKPRIPDSTSTKFVDSGIRIPLHGAKQHCPENFHENLVPLPTYISFHLILRSFKVFLKTFSTKIKPTKCPAKEKKRGKKSEKGGEERKLSAHARTSQTNILRLNQKARSVRLGSRSRVIS